MSSTNRHHRPQFLHAPVIIYLSRCPWPGYRKFSSIRDDDLSNLLATTLVLDLRNESLFKEHLLNSSCAWSCMLRNEIREDFWRISCAISSHLGDFSLISAKLSASFRIIGRASSGKPRCDEKSTISHSTPQISLGSLQLYAECTRNQYESSSHRFCSLTVGAILRCSWRRPFHTCTTQDTAHQGTAEQARARGSAAQLSARAKLAHEEALLGCLHVHSLCTARVHSFCGGGRDGDGCCRNRP